MTKKQIELKALEDLAILKARELLEIMDKLYIVDEMFANRINGIIHNEKFLREKSYLKRSNKC